MNMADGTATVSRRVIRIDTAVNHGNSGGPLFNDNGKLIGIVSAKLETSSVDNIGYAIPSNVACAVADNIIDNCANTTSKTVQLATLGVTVTPKNSEARLDTATGKITKIEQSEIVSTTPGSAADGKLLPKVFTKDTVNNTAPKTEKEIYNTYLLNLPLLLSFA